MGTATTNTALKIVSQIVIPHSPSVPLMLLRPDTLPEPFITYMDIFAAAARQDFVTPLLFTSAAEQSMIDAETAFVR